MSCLSGTAELRANEERIGAHLALTRNGPVEILRIDREDRLGALNLQCIDDLRCYVEGLSRSPDVRVLVITSTGRGFVAGADIEVYHGASQVEFDRFQRRSRAVFDGLAALPQIVICAVNGYALGGGFELALACDFILASTAASFGLPEVKLGLLPGGGGTQRLPRLIGAMRAKELVLSGRRIDAGEAEKLGIVLDVVDPDSLIPRAIELASRFAAQAPLAIIEGKRVIDDGTETALASGLTFEQRVLSGLFASDDGKEGIAAFIEKRPPRFSGR